MKIPVLNQYTSRYLNNEYNTNGSATEVRKTQKAREEQKTQRAGSEAPNSENLISRRERDFFIRMFPENSEQLERHVLFNRNGKIQSADIMKGTLIDGRI